tara:strand:+ start:2612 stop:2863 length:252 start_codon:yes stop_codon:yes gene_type:complete
MPSRARSVYGTVCQHIRRRRRAFQPHEKELAGVKQVALAAFVADAESIGADAVVAIKLDYEAIDGDKRTLLMVFKNGTAVKLK